MASARLASPVTVDPTELSPGGKGLVEYKAQTNFPNPWKGGTWRLRDTMDYEHIASDALLEACTNLKEDLLRNRARMALASIAAGDASTFYRIPAQQADPVAGARMASYPEDARDILASGWIKGAERLERKAAAVALELGKGRVVLFGFRVQHRAQTEGTFKLLFNALHWSAMGE